MLAGLTRNVCPECGKPFDPARRRSFTRHPRLRKWGRRISLSVLGVLILYVASYYWALQRPRLINGGLADFALILPASEGGLQLLPKYRVGGDVALLVYKPVHAVDRKLRPNRWYMTLRTEQQLWAGM